MIEATTDIAKRPACRRFSIGDAMILILAAGLWLAIARDGLGILADAVRKIPYGSLVTRGDWQRYLFRKSGFGQAFLTYGNLLILGGFTFFLPAFLMVRLRRPRPGLRQLIRQPGFVGCAAPAAACILMLPISPILGWVEGQATWVMFLAAPAAWAVLACSRTWEREPGWIDRLGVGFSVLWVISMAIHLFVSTIVPI